MLCETWRRGICASPSASSGSGSLFSFSTAADGFVVTLFLPPLLLPSLPSRRGRSSAVIRPVAWWRSPGSETVFFKSLAGASSTSGKRACLRFRTRGCGFGGGGGSGTSSLLLLLVALLSSFSSFRSSVVLRLLRRPVSPIRGSRALAISQRSRPMTERTALDGLVRPSALPSATELTVLCVQDAESSTVSVCALSASLSISVTV
ncbi:hypothetical protein HDK64DRAFT_269536 [Phyllosticta capitalensis]